MGKIVKKFQEGCTGISWIVGAFGRKLPGHECCDEHDVAYIQGGSWKFKAQMDARLAKCIAKKNGNGVVGWVKAILAYSAVTFFPYAYFVWHQPEPIEDVVERELNRNR